MSFLSRFRKPPRQELPPVEQALSALDQSVWAAIEGYSRTPQLTAEKAITPYIVALGYVQSHLEIYGETPGVTAAELSANVATICRQRFRFNTTPDPQGYREEYARLLEEVRESFLSHYEHVPAVAEAEGKPSLSSLSEEASLAGSSVEQGRPDRGF